VKVEYLSFEDLLFMAKALGLGAVKDVGALDAATARARSRVFGQDAYPSLELKAAALMHSICRVQGLVAGNESLALVAASDFLGSNGSRFVVPHDVALDLTAGITEGRLDVPQIADVLTN
jgi:death-on-curing protein